LCATAPQRVCKTIDPYSGQAILILVTGGAGFSYVDFSSSITRQGALACTEIYGALVEFSVERRR